MFSYSYYFVIGLLVLHVLALMLEELNLCCIVKHLEFISVLYFIEQTNV